MLQQKNFYKAIERLGGMTQVKSAFRQIGDPIEAGYLPKNSGGTCSNTTLDFHRAVSQGCENQWMSAAGQAKNDSSILQATIGRVGNNFGLRQQLQFVSIEQIVKDRLYTRSLPDAQGQTLVDSIVPNSRQPKAQLESFSPRDLATEINTLLSENPQNSIRLNFIVNDKREQYGHTIAICQSRDGQNLYIMDPNAGVITTNREEIGAVLETLRSSLYKDYTLSETTLETQDKFWLDPAHPLTDDVIEGFKAEEVTLLTACTPDLYKAHQKAQAAIPVVDCDYDEAVFNDAAWNAAPEVVVAQSAVSVGAHEYKAMVKHDPTPLPQLTALTTAAKSGPEAGDDDWDRINERPGGL